MTTEALIKRLENAGYYADSKTATALNAAMTLKKPLLIEGESGVGKTSLAIALADAMNYELIRLQMYEGLTDDKILYDFDYTKQLLSLEAVRKTAEKKYAGWTTQKAMDDVSKSINFYTDDFLIERPVLRSISGKRGDKRKVLLIDEIDKAPEELEYMFYEFFENYSISIPQTGETKTCDPSCTPIVIMTSNGYRELSQALKRRCAYLYMPMKSADEMAEIISRKADVDMKFARNISGWLDRFGQSSEIVQKPSLAEGIDWTKYLAQEKERTNDGVLNSLGILFKNEHDLMQAAKTMKDNPKAMKCLVNDGGAAT